MPEVSPKAPSSSARSPFRVLATLLAIVAALAALTLALSPSIRVWCGFVPGGRFGRDSIHLVIIHTNDIHGEVLAREEGSGENPSSPGLGGLVRLVQEIEALHAAEPQAIVVDAGDWYSGTPEGAVDRGLPLLQILAQVGFDAMCVGNHDFDHGIANVERLVREAGLPAVLANVRSPGVKERLPWARPWIVVERNGVRVALVGLLTTTTKAISSGEVRALDFASPAEELDRVRLEIGDKADLIIPVAHIRVREARQLALHDPNLPLIITGHSHEILEKGELQGDTLIVQAGSKARAFGRVDLWLDPKTFAPLRSKARVIELRKTLKTDLPANAKSSSIQVACEELVQRASVGLDQQVGELAQPVVRAVTNECSPAGAWITDALRAHMGAEIAVHNRGRTRRDLPAGGVTRRELFELLPFDDHAVSVDLTGEQVAELARRSIDRTRFLGVDFSGLTRFVAQQSDGSFKITRVEVGGRALDPSKRYRVATSSHLANGGGGTDELLAGLNLIEDSALLREVLEQDFVRRGRISLPEDMAQRFIVEQP
ncbi:MAG TPA: bifunctional UDP-sugar hydrolase/5'-nucleotidase [Planctomycetota bacterium]|nr:bifunctional UDP-sugar hydrolase/5'-nucleotidase [Planctomycetota bacterium]